MNLILIALRALRAWRGCSGGEMRAHLMLFSDFMERLKQFERILEWRKPDCCLPLHRLPQQPLTERRSRLGRRAAQSSWSRYRSPR